MPSNLPPLNLQLQTIVNTTHFIHLHTQTVSSPLYNGNAPPLKLIPRTKFKPSHIYNIHYILLLSWNMGQYLTPFHKQVIFCDLHTVTPTILLLCFPPLPPLPLPELHVLPPNSSSLGISPQHTCALTRKQFGFPIALYKSSFIGLKPTHPISIAYITY
jgi:hypothetical protein